MLSRPAARKLITETKSGGKEIEPDPDRRNGGKENVL
jgi:hypothetical protein